MPLGTQTVNYETGVKDFLKNSLFSVITENIENEKSKVLVVTFCTVLMEYEINTTETCEFTRHRCTLNCDIEKLLFFLYKTENDANRRLIRSTPFFHFSRSYLTEKVL